MPHNNMSRIVRKPDFCLCKNKGADQLRSNCEADQRLCFRYSDSTIPLLLKSEISSFWLFSELVQAGLCRTWSETPKTGFLTSRLRWYRIQKDHVMAPKMIIFLYMSRLVGKPTMWFPNRSDTNRTVQALKGARSLKYRI